MDDADHLDLVVTNRFGDSISVVLGMGDGAYRGGCVPGSRRPVTIAIGVLTTTATTGILPFATFQVQATLGGSRQYFGVAGNGDGTFAEATCVQGRI